MDRSFIKYGLTVIAFVVILAIFVNREPNETSYRGIVGNLNELSGTITTNFVDGYIQMNNEQTYDKAFLQELTDKLREQQAAYLAIIELPEKALEDQISLDNALAYQIDSQEAMIAYCIDGQSIPGELILELKKSIDKRELYERRLLNH